MTDRYLVQTQSQTKSSRKNLPEVHGIKKTLHTISLPERKKQALKLKIIPKLNQDYDKVEQE